MHREIPQRYIQTPSDKAAVEVGCYYDDAEPKRVKAFIETFCRQSKHPFHGQLISLLPWQQALIDRLYGWRGPDGERRYKSCLLSIAKKNGA